MGNIITSERGGVFLFMDKISNVSEQVKLLNAVIESMGLDQKKIQAVEKKKKLEK